MYFQNIKSISNGIIGLNIPNIKKVPIPSHLNIFLFFRHVHNVTIGLVKRRMVEIRNCLKILISEFESTRSNYGRSFL